MRLPFSQVELSLDEIDANTLTGTARNLWSLCTVAEGPNGVLCALTAILTSGDHHVDC